MPDITMHAGQEHDHSALRRVLQIALLVAGAWLLLAVVSSASAHAAPVDPHPVTVHQPDGTTFTAVGFGDENANGLETNAGFTVVRGSDHYFQYAARRADGTLAPSGKRVGRDTPAGLAKHLRATTGEAAAGAPAGANYAAAPPASFTGNQPTLLILAQFSDQTSATTASSWATAFFGAGTGTVKDYYSKVSDSKMTVSPVTESYGTANDGVVGWVTLPMAHPNTGSTTGSPLNQAAVKAAIEAADAYVDFGSYDTNSDGYISANELHVTVIAAGFESASCATCGNGIWGHRSSLLGTSTPTVDGVFVGFDQGQLGGYTLFGELHSDGTTSWRATIGIMVHELGHDLYLPDLYDTDLSTQGIGNWSVMGTGVWLATGSNKGGTSPAFMDPFSRSYEGWITTTRLTGTQSGITIPQAETSPTAYQLGDNANGIDWSFQQASGSGEYYLVENRQLTGYDAALNGCGLLIWHIDETRTSNNAANATESRRLVDIKVPDGSLGSPASARGDAADPWPGTTAKTTFNGASTPNSNWYDGSASGISITNISSCSSTMTADFHTDDASPANDQLQDAVVAPFLPYSSPFVHTGDAGIQQSETAPFGCTSMYRTVWYRYTAPVDMRISADTTGSYFNTVLAAYRGTAFNNLVSVGCNDDIAPGSNTASRVEFEALAGQTFLFQAGGTTGEGNWLTLAIKGLTNDSFAHAVAMSPMPYHPGVIDTSPATIETGETNPQGCPSMFKTVWFKYTPAQDKWVRVSTAGSDFDTVMVGYQGTTLGGLTSMGCSNDTNGQAYSALDFRVTGGQTYYFQVGGISGQSGALMFDAYEDGIVGNDDFAHATAFTSSYVTSESTDTAGLEQGEFTPQGCPGPGKTVWFKYAPTTDSYVQLSTAGSDFDTTMNVWSGTALNNLQYVGCNNDESQAGGPSKVSYKALAGQTYYIQIGGYNGTHGSLAFTATVDPVPVNDLFSGAIAIPMIGGSYGTSTDSADLEPNEFTPQGCPGPGKTLWYKFTPTGSDANVTLSTQYSSFDTTMNVWSGTALTDLQYVACNNDVDGSNNWSRTTFRAHLGQTYYVQVGGYFGVHGYLYLDAKVDPVPANDDFANATLLTSGPHEGTLTNASVQPNEPVATNCAVTSRTAWFKLVPLVDTWVDVAIPGTAPGTTLTAYKGSSLTGLTPVGCATPPGNVTNYDPVLSFPTAAGQTYYLQLGAIPSSTFAYFDIDVSLATIPTSDHFASAETIGFDADGYASGGIYDMDHLGLDAGEPQPAGCTASAHTAWLKYTPTENADMHAGAYFPGLGTLTVWRGTSLNALTKVACLTTTTANGQAEIPFAALAGQTYYVQVGPTTGSMVIMDWWANFTPHTGNGLTVVPAGTGTGTVTSDVGGIYCGSVCGAILDPATQVVLTAYPAYGSTFSGWSGACSGTGTCGVSMSAERTVTATFADVPATAVITAPTMPTAQTVVAFNQSVHGVSASNVRLVPTGSSTPVSATVTCVNASAAAVSCATGPARSARLTTTSPLMPGGSYTAIVNPAGASPIRDAANTIVPTVTKAVRTLTVQAESLPSTPAWGTVSASGSAFGGSYTTERLAGAAQTWSFTGTSVTWWTLRNRAQGKAGIYIDGVFNATVSNYLNSSTTGYRYGRTYAGLTNTPHTIEVRVLGQVGATVAGAGTYVSVDAFSTGTAGCSLTTTIATCSATPGSKYKWASTTSTSPAYTGLTTDILGATMSLTFRGTGVDVCRVLASDQGKMTVQVDGGALTTLDNYAATRTITGSAIYAIRGLTSGQHTVKLRVLHQPHTGATGTRITIDKWRVV